MSRQFQFVHGNFNNFNFLSIDIVIPIRLLRTPNETLFAKFWAESHKHLSQRSISFTNLFRQRRMYLPALSKCCLMINNLQCTWGLLLEKLKLLWINWNCREWNWNRPRANWNCRWVNWNCREQIEIAVTLLGDRIKLESKIDALSFGNKPSLSLRSALNHEI